MDSRETVALAHDLDHWLNAMASTRTGSQAHRKAQNEVLTLVLHERTAILAALRTSGTDRAEAEEIELPAGEPITEEASDAALEIAQAIEPAIQVRGIFSYAPDGRPCLTWYGEQRIVKVIDAHLEDGSAAEETRAAVESALTEWTRPSAIRLMIGETVTRQEGRTANAVATAIAGKVRAAIRALSPQPEGGARGE